MSGRILSIRIFAYALSAFLAIVPGISLSQSEGEQEIEEIVVTGIRVSQEQALEVKRNSTGFVDAISAEDIGKLPDQNVAEAIQRVPGVAIQRDNGEGNFVSIRGLGPEFVRATVNGRTIASTEGGREFNFDVLASETVETLEVIKTPSARLEEGGIGGTINLNTARPLDIGTRNAGALRANYNEFSTDWNPRASALASWVNGQSTLGALLSASYSDNRTRSDRSTSFGYSNQASFGGMQSGYDTDGDGVRDFAGDPWFPFSANLEHDLQDRERISFVGAVQFRPDDATELVFDALYSSFDIGRDLQQSLILTAPILVPPEDNADRSVTLRELVISPSDPDTVLSSTHAGFNLTSVGVESENDTETLLLGANLRRDLGSWALSADVAFSSAEADFRSRQAVLEATQLGPDFSRLLFYEATVTTANGVIGLQQPDLSNPGLYTTRNIDSSFNQTDDEETSVRLDAERLIGAGNLDSAQFGIAFRSREKGLTPSDFNNSPGRRPVTGGIYENAAVEDFLNDDPVDFAALLFPDVDPWYDYVLGEFGLTEDLRVNRLSTFAVEEDVASAYGQLNFDGEMGGVAFTGNVGARVVQTAQSSRGFSVPFELVINDDGIGNIVLGSSAEDIVTDNDYTNVLPSLNLLFEFDDNLFLRVAASKVVTRPTLSNLGPSISINATQQTATAGNPGLEPFVSDQFDLGVEWYFADASALYGAVFYKNVGNFVATVSGPETISGVDFIDVSRPRNAESAEVRGFEIGYQQAFTHLPAPWDGLGLVANLTQTDSTAEFDPSVTSTVFALEGLSKYTYNLIAYYDRGPLQARLAWNFRDDFLRQAVGTFNNSFFTVAYEQVDASISYDINPNVTLFLEGVNLTNSFEDEYAFIPARPFARAVTGSRYAFGARATF